jgi:ribose transport system substrate-binding protein
VSELRADRPYRIALVVKNRTNPAYVSAMKSGDDASARYGIEVAHHVPVKPDDLDQQNALMRGVIEGGALDAMAFTPVDADAQVELIEQANRAGLPLFNFSNQMPRGEVVSFVGSDDVAIGRHIIDWLARTTSGSAKLAVISGSPQTPTARDRLRGVQQALTQHAGLVLLAEESANYDRLKAQMLADKFLTEHPDLEWIVALNDDMALGAALAVAIEGKQADVRITGVNGIPEGLIAVKDGRLAASVDYALYSIAGLSIELAVRYLNGERLPQRSYLLPTPVIDGSNVDELIAQRRGWGIM